MGTIAGWRAENCPRRPARRRAARIRRQRKTRWRRRPGAGGGAGAGEAPPAAPPESAPPAATCGAACGASMPGTRSTQARLLANISCAMNDLVGHGHGGHDKAVHAHRAERRREGREAVAFDGRLERAVDVLWRAQGHEVLHLQSEVLRRGLQALVLQSFGFRCGAPAADDRLLSQALEVRKEALNRVYLDRRPQSPSPRRWSSSSSTPACRYDARGCRERCYGGGALPDGRASWCRGSTSDEPPTVESPKVPFMISERMEDPTGTGGCRVERGGRVSPPCLLSSVGLSARAFNGREPSSAR